MKSWIAGLVAIGACALGANADPPQAPAPTERAGWIAKFHADYPDWPAHMLDLIADAHGAMHNGAPCELVDWVLGPKSGVNDTGLQRAARIAQPTCSLPIDDITAETAETRLGADPFRMDISGDTLTVIARSTEPDVGICCSVHGSLTRFGGGPYWAGRWRMADIDRALINVRLTDATAPDRVLTFRGRSAPAAPAETDLKSLHGKLVAETLPSKSLGEARKLMIYLPPGYDARKTWPVVFMTDGGAIEYAGMVEAAIEAGEMRPLVLVSSEAAPDGIDGPAPTKYGQDLRAADYLKGGPSSERFAQHMAFFSDELVSWATTAYNLSMRREDRTVAGESNGAVFAMWAADAHPEVFGAGVAMSPGFVVGEPGDAKASVRARFFFGGGRYEPEFISTAQKAEAGLKAKGYDASGLYLTAGHYHDQWVIVLHEALKRIYPAH